jgi:hypothetical protein
MKMNTRLATVAPELVDWAESLATNRRKMVACAIAQWACHKTHIVNVLGEIPMQRMLQPTYSATPEDRAMLGIKADALDEQYLSIADQGDVSDRDLRGFEQARALSSLLYSFDAQDLASFCETLYEAQAVTDDLEAFRQLCGTCSSGYTAGPE